MNSPARARGLQGLRRIPVPAVAPSDSKSTAGRPNPLALPLLKEAWRLRLRISGFHDLENPEDPDGPLSNAGQPSHFDTADSVTVQSNAAYYRRIGRLEQKLPFGRDRAIAEMLADGHGIRSIKSKLRCGQGKVERVQREIRSWVPESKCRKWFGDDEGEGE